MAVSYVGVTSGNSGSATSTSFVTTLPAGWAAGDVAILSGHVRGTSLTMATPAGWTLVPGPTWPVNQGTNSRVYAWYRVLQAGDTPPTITNSGSMTGGWSMTAYRGADTTSPIGQVGTATVSGTSVTLPALTGVLAGSALAVATHAGVASGTIPTNITPDAAYTEVVDHATSRVTTAANQRMEAAYRLIASAGSYGGESFSTTVTSSMVAVLVEVKQATSSDATVAPDGVAVGVAVGSPAVDGSLAVAPVGLAAAVAVGAPSAAWSAVVAPVGLAVPVVVGDPSAVGAGLVPDGLAVPVVVGAPAVAWSASVGPVGLSVSAAVGVPAAVWAAEVGPDGLLVPLEVGSPAVSVPGAVVTRPDLGVAVRPSAGVVVRPSTGTVARPSAGVVSRPDAGLVSRP